MCLCVCLFKSVNGSIYPPRTPPRTPPRPPLRPSGQLSILSRFTGTGHFPIWYRQGGWWAPWATVPPTPPTPPWTESGGIGASDIPSLNGRQGVLRRPRSPPEWDIMREKESIRRTREPADQSACMQIDGHFEGQGPVACINGPNRLIDGVAPAPDTSCSNK